MCLLISNAMKPLPFSSSFRARVTERDAVSVEKERGRERKSPPDFGGYVCQHFAQGDVCQLLKFSPKLANVIFAPKIR